MVRQWGRFTGSLTGPLTCSVASKLVKRPACEANHRGAAFQCRHQCPANAPRSRPLSPLLPPAGPLFDRNAACASGRILPCLTSSAWILQL
jgi:hypothetical protein